MLQGLRTFMPIFMTSAFAAVSIGLSPAAVAAEKDSVVVAGGCFWCVESDFESLPGVIEATSGYTGGHTKNPTYKEVGKGKTGHYEAVKIDFDPSKITAQKIYDLFLRSVDVTDDGGQFCDRGPMYRTALFVRPDQKSAAQAAISKANKDLGQKVVTPILDATVFYEAEDYHQDYYKGENYVLTRFGPRTQKAAYKLYRNACGRDDRVKQLWGSKAAFVK
jgi:peptide-methionine (S)-S-oxide reductase